MLGCFVGRFRFIFSMVHTKETGFLGILILSNLGQLWKENGVSFSCGKYSFLSFKEVLY